MILEVPKYVKYVKKQLIWWIINRSQVAYTQLYLFGGVGVHEINKQCFFLKKAHITVKEIFFFIAQNLKGSRGSISYISRM